jgi:hypothetical protein
MAKTLLTIENLTYEELILLQDIMMYMDKMVLPFEYDIKMLDSLYEKVINS